MDLYERIICISRRAVTSSNAEKKHGRHFGRRLQKFLTKTFEINFIQELQISFWILPKAKTALCLNSIISQTPLAISFAEYILHSFVLSVRS